MLTGSTGTLLGLSACQKDEPEKTRACETGDMPTWTGALLTDRVGAGGGSSADPARGLRGLFLARASGGIHGIAVSPVGRLQSAAEAVVVGGGGGLCALC